MSDPEEVNGGLPGGRWLWWPFAITLAVTLLRLCGELQGWSLRWFGTAAGGGGAIVGISWLVPVFGFWFGRRLVAQGRRPASLPRAFVRFAGGIGLVITGFVIVKTLLGTTWFGMVVGMLGCVAGAALAWPAWPALGRTLLVYGVTARLPVVAISAVAIANGWGTHYEKLADGAPALAPVPTFLILTLAQAAFWLPITMLGGGLFGLVAVARQPRSPDASTRE